MVRLLTDTTYFAFLAELRYPGAYFANLVSTALFLALLVLGGRALQVDGGETALFLAFVALAGLQGPARALEDASSDAEELYLYPFPPLFLIFAHTASLALRTLLNFSLVYLMLTWPLSLPLKGLLQVWSYAPLALVAGFGPGLLLGGLTLLLKRTGTLVNLLAIVVLGSAFLPPAILNLVAPYSPFMAVLGLTRGRADAMAVMGLSLIHLAIGCLAYYACERLVFRMGLSGVR